MYKQHGQFHFSPSDLTRYMESPFASWMDRFAVEYPDQVPEKDPADALMSSTLDQLLMLLLMLWL